jgi:RHS repeat-associated protein
MIATWIECRSWLHLNGHRDFDPAVGRYTESDPIGLRGGSNTYAYVGGNPVSNVDPSGLFFTSVDAAYAIDPNFCAEIMGQIVRNAAAINNASDPDNPSNACLEQAADSVANALSTIANIATILPLASNIAGVPNLAKQLDNENQLAQVLANQGNPIAGAGASKPIRDIVRIVQEYGGKVSDWSKVTSYPYQTPAGQIIEVHAYETLATGQVVEPKSVMNWF